MLKKLTLSKWHCIIYLSLQLLLLPDSVYAASKFSNVHMSGFIMQSYIKTENNNFLGSSVGKGSLGYTEIGINGFVKVSPRLQFASQLLSRRAGKTDDGKPRVDFALLDYRLIDKSNYGLGLRMGRVKNPFGFYNETRDVSFTRENIILPQSIYFERTRDLSVSSDAMHVYGHKQTTIGLFNGTFVVGMPRVTDENTEYALLGDSKSGEFVAKPSLIGRVRFESNDSRITGAFSHVRLFLDYDPAESEAPSFNGNGEVDFKMNIFSLKYNLMRWSFVGEYAQRKVKSDGIAYIPSDANNKTGESFYVQSIFRFNHKWNVIARYDVLYADKEDRDGMKFTKLLLAKQVAVKNYSRYAKDIMLGVQFKMSRYWMSRLELHSVDGTAWLPKQDNADESMIERKWKMLNYSMSYRF
ncbi:MAG: hypothetical protein OEM38_03325 [Gammaproteobacteria bacterium]|nr:hypothetical protein [Gammaproteobacteria bacterium]